MESYIAEQRRAIADLRPIYKSGMMGTDLAQTIVALDEIVRGNMQTTKDDFKASDDKLIQATNDLKEDFKTQLEELNSQVEDLRMMQKVQMAKLSKKGGDSATPSSKLGPKQMD